MLCDSLISRHKIYSFRTPTPPKMCFLDIQPTVQYRPDDPERHLWRVSVLKSRPQGRQLITRPVGVAPRLVERRPQAQIAHLPRARQSQAQQYQIEAPPRQPSPRMHYHQHNYALPQAPMPPQYHHVTHAIEPRQDHHGDGRLNRITDVLPLPIHEGPRRRRSRLRNAGQGRLQLEQRNDSWQDLRDGYLSDDSTDSWNAPPPR